MKSDEVHSVFKDLPVIDKALAEEEQQALVGGQRPRSDQAHPDPEAPAHGEEGKPCVAPQPVTAVDMQVFATGERRPLLLTQQPSDAVAAPVQQ